MKKITFTFLIAIFCIAMSCSLKKNDNTSSEIQTKNNETFENFFEKFRNEKNYQITRVIFPLEYWYFDEHPDAIVDTLIPHSLTKNKWEFTEFDSLISETLNNESGIDRYRVKVEDLDSSKVYSLVGMDNGININYYFKKIDNNWFLYKIIDNTL